MKATIYHLYQEKIYIGTPEKDIMAIVQVRLMYYEPKYDTVPGVYAFEKTRGFENGKGDPTEYRGVKHHKTYLARTEYDYQSHRAEAIREAVAMFDDAVEGMKLVIKIGVLPLAA